MSNCYLEYEWKSEKRLLRLDNDETFRIDRSKLSAVDLSEDPTVSLRHAMVQRLEGNNFYLTDLNSRNGTMLNGRPITVPTLLKTGDVIRIGTCEFVFYLEDAESPGAAEATASWNTKFQVSRKLITVLVADIKDYTGLTLKLGESFICEMIGTLFQEAGRVLSANDTWGQKYIGDALMGVWIHAQQVPAPREFELIFRSVVAIKGVFGTINERYGLVEPITFGIGINTGHAAIGNMGSRQSPDFTALGDAVNKTFRLEAATRELGVDIVFGNLTYDFLSALTGTPVGLTRKLVHLKGYPEAETAYVTDFSTVERLIENLQPNLDESLT
jgi:adenylate cyclase